VVMSKRPATIQNIINVDLPAAGPGFTRLPGNARCNLCRHGMSLRIARVKPRPPAPMERTRPRLRDLFPIDRVA